MKIVSTFLKPFRLHAMRGFAASARHGGDPGDTRSERATRSTASSDEAGDADATGGVSQWLFPQVVLLDCDVRDKRELLDLAASTLERFHGVASAPVARALWRRESAVSTALGNGVAVPHARIGGIADPVTLLIRTLRPIAYGAPDRKPVSQLFVILVPDEGEPDEHLRLLANVAEVFSQREFRERIATATDMRSVRRAFEDFSHAIGRDAPKSPTQAAPRVNGEASASSHHPSSRSE